MERGHCWVCGGEIHFDPTKVRRVNGRPLCARCVARVNVYLREAGQAEAIIEEGTYRE